MKLTITLLFLINAYFLNAKSLPIETASGVVVDNPCKSDSLLALKFYYPYPNDETRYIECDPWGVMHVKMCDAGSKWNSWLSSCVIPVPDSQMPTHQMVNLTIPDEYCSYQGNYTCLNGGICNQFLVESRCFCLVNFTGYHCEIPRQSLGAFGQLINDSFSLELYKHQRPLANDTLTFNTSFDTSLILDDATKQRVQKYLDLFPRGEMRFDTMINYLVQDFLSQIYPSSFFLNEFLLQGEIEMGYSNAVPNLMQTAQYGFEKFDNMFMIFEQVLDNLVDYLTKYEPKVKQEAQSFFEVYDLIFSKLNANATSGMEKVDNRTDLTRDEMKQTIYGDFNQTLSWSYDLFRYLNRFDDELSLKNYTTEEMAYAIGNFTMDVEVTRMLSEIQVINSEIWDSLSFYGFWYVISSYVDIPDQTKVDSGSKRVFERPQALMGSSTTDVDYDFSTDSSDSDALVAETTPFSLLDSKPISPISAGLSADKDLLKSSLSTLIADKLNEETTVTPRAGLLSAQSTPKPKDSGKVQKPKKTSPVDSKKPNADQLVGDMTTVTPRAAQLVGDMTTVTPRVGQLVGDMTTVTPRVGQLVGDMTTVTPRVGQLVDETTPRVGQLVVETTVTPRTGQLVDETTPRFGQIVGETTVTPRAGQIVDETTPRVGQLVGETTPRAGLLIDDSKVTPRAGQLVDETTPRVGQLVGETTPRFGQLVVETTVTPRAGQLVDESTPKTKVQKPKSSQLILESTTVMPKSAGLSGSVTIAPKVSALFDESTTVSHDYDDSNFSIQF